MRQENSQLGQYLNRHINGRTWLFGQKRRKVGRLQRQAARCFFVTQEASSVKLGTWRWPRVVLIEKRPDGIRAIIDESSCAVGWCAADQASRSQQLDLARAR